MLSKFSVLFHPERYQGIGKTKRYFEGWYYKLITANEKKAIAVIPGVAMDKKGTRHGFIQVLDGKENSSEYYKFDYSAFSYKTDRFEIQLGSNLFTPQSLVLDMPEISGSLTFSNPVEWTDHFYAPGIMGPYTFVPFMECYHGIISLDHDISGALKYKGQEVDFTDGKGYIEKDWGHTFPSAYFWIQSNHFSNDGISFKASVAKIPWLRSSFTGFIAGVWVNNKLYKFTTYNGTKLLRSFADRKCVKLMFKNRHYVLTVLAHRENEAELASPIAGLMEGRINESMTSEIDIRLTDKKGNVIFEDRGRNAGLEVAGNITEIFTS
ncbi:tocopherol cyclase family protein [Saccharicrinis sp. FJH62]|uniref:tocopherol cyclase family protein n=1 Tax=Saccharicrinis sp. FJH62 TaxID=3344657 RepID=UPI0035D5179D